MPRTVITGGAGFLGSHLADRLSAHGHDVVIIDNLITGNAENIRHLLEAGKAQFIRHDVSQHIEVEGPVDYVYHLASPASPIDYLQLPIQTLKVGSLGTHNSLGLAKAKNAAYLIASTSEVYGDPQIHPQPETYWGNVNPIGPRGVYDEAKRFLEAITMAYHRTHGVNTHIIRIFNTYGPRMRPNDGRVVPTFIVQSLKGEPISIFGDGSQTRSFCHCSDLVRGMHLLMESNEHGPVNIGNPHEMTMLQFADAIRAATGSSSVLAHHPLPEDDPKLRRPIIDRARTLLGWEPKIELEEGLGDTVAYFRDLLKRGAI